MLMVSKKNEMVDGYSNVACDDDKHTDDNDGAGKQSLSCHSLYSCSDSGHQMGTRNVTWAKARNGKADKIGTEQGEGVEGWWEEMNRKGTSRREASRPTMRLLSPLSLKSGVRDGLILLHPDCHWKCSQLPII